MGFEPILYSLIRLSLPLDYAPRSYALTKSFLYLHPKRPTSGGGFEPPFLEQIKRPT